MIVALLYLQWVLAIFQHPKTCCIHSVLAFYKNYCSIFRDSFEYFEAHGGPPWGSILDLQQQSIFCFHIECFD